MRKEAIITFSTQFSVGVNITLSPAQNGLKSTEIEAEGVHGGMHLPIATSVSLYGVYLPFYIILAASSSITHLPHTNLLQRKQ